MESDVVVFGFLLLMPIKFIHKNEHINVLRKENRFNFSRSDGKLI